MIAALTLSGASIVAAQSNIATTPARGSTGPTVSDTRPVDQKRQGSSVEAPPAPETASTGTQKP